LALQATSYSETQPAEPSLPSAREAVILCQELESASCALGWVLRLEDDAYLRADSSRIQLSAWSSKKDRFTFSGRILSYSEESQSWKSVDALFLGCHTPTANTSSSVFEYTIYLYCGDAIYAFRRADVEPPYTCVRFAFENSREQLFWGCFEKDPLGRRMMDLSLRTSHNPSVLTPPDTWAWTISVHNDAAFRSDANEVVVTATLPLGALLQQATTSQGSCHSAIEASLKIVCSLGTVRSDTTVTIEVVVAVDPDVPFRQLTARATVTLESTSWDPLESNNLATEAATVEVKNFVVSPLCVPPQGSITLSGLSLDVAKLGPDDAQVGGKPAQILAASSSGLVVELPDLPSGVSTVILKGVPGFARVTVDPSCEVRTPSTEDVQTGFVAGEVLIFFKESLSTEQLEHFRVEYGFKSLVEYPALGLYRAVLGDTPIQISFKKPLVACPASKRDTAPQTDLLLLIDRSGTMDESRLKPLLVELSRQMYCLLSRNSRVSVLTYNNEVRQELTFASWSNAHYEALTKWVQQPLRANNTSNLEQALHLALDSFEISGRPEVPKTIMVITRGPALPPLKNTQSLMARAQQQGVAIEGLGMLSPFFLPRSYEGLRQIAQATGRDVLFWQEQLRWALPQVAQHALVQGVYGIAQCEEDCLERIPATAGTLSGETMDVIELLNRDPRVDQAFFNDLLDRSQGDPRISDQKWLEDLGLPRGWEDFFPHQGSGVTIAVIDTGADLTLAQSRSPELVISALAPEGLNFAPGATQQKHPLGQDELGHGTAVSTIATASNGNGINGAGVAPKATLIPIKVFAKVGTEVKASNESVAQALMSAFSLGVDVINMSLGCYGCAEKAELQLRKYYEKLLNNLMRKARQGRGKLPVIVAASGNDGEHLIDAPAAISFVIAVGSVELDLQNRSNFSNYGPELDLVAVGESNLTTVAGGGFKDPGSGTSFSAPQVSGLVALILAEEPGLSPQAVQEKIQQCFAVDVGPPGFDEETGWGRIWIPPLSQAKPECRRKE